MKKITRFFTLMVALVATLSFSARAASVLPAADDGKWYNVKSQRGGAGVWWTKTGTKIIPNQLTNSSEQKFTLVTSSAGKVTIKSSDGQLFNGTDFDGSGTTDGWTITEQNVQGVVGVSFPGQNNGLHQGGSGWSWQMQQGYYDLSDNCTFFFYEEGTYVEPPTFNNNQDGFVLVGDDRFTITSEAGTTIKYTTDGSDPITSSTAITSSSNSVTLTITSATTAIKAYTIDGTKQSDVATFDKIVTEAELGKEYHIVFQRNGGISALTAGDPLTLQHYTIGQDNQVFVFGKATTDGLYTLTTRSGQAVQFTSDRFRNNATTTNEELRIVQHKKTGNYEIERKSMPTEGMNPDSGFVNGNEIGDWTNGNASNEVNFVEAPAAGSSDAPTFSVGDKTVVITNDVIQILAPKAAEITYTTDGTDPETSGTATTVNGTSVDITIATDGTVVKAFAKETGKSNSPVVEATYYTIDLNYTKEYQIVFRRNGNAVADNLAIKAGSNDGDLLVLDNYSGGQNDEIFTISKSSTTKGLYILTTKLGKTVYYEGANNGGRFKTGTTQTELRIIKFEGSDPTYKTFEPGYSIQRIGNTGSGMNPPGGSLAGKPISEWTNGDGGNSLNFKEVLPLITLTVEKASGTETYGTVAISGETTTTVTKNPPITITATPNPGHVFVKWSDGTNEYTSRSYTYSGDQDVTFTATFEKLGEGTVGVPAKGKYYFIQSANQGGAGNGQGDFRNNVIYADGDADGLLKHGSVPADENYALWEIIDDNGTQKLKNKGSKKYLHQSKNQDATGQAYSYTLIGSNQYSMHNEGSNRTCAWWANGNLDKTSGAGELDGSKAWYFVYHSDKSSTGVKDVINNKYQILISNGTINVLGVDTFVVYNLAGQQVNEKQKLQAGIYIVKAKDFVRKVVVR